MLESSIVDEWRAEGRAEGMVEAWRDNLLRVLQFRFPASVPVVLEAAIQSQTDRDKLSAWFDAALRVASLEEFRAVVGQ